MKTVKFFLNVKSSQFGQRNMYRDIQLALNLPVKLHLLCIVVSTPFMWNSMRLLWGCTEISPKVRSRAAHCFNLEKNLNTCVVEYNTFSDITAKIV